MLDLFDSLRLAALENLVAELRPGLDDGRTRAVVHAAIGAVQSVAAYDSGLPRDQQADLLTKVAHACLAAGGS